MTDKFRYLYVGLGSRCVPYPEAWELQRTMHQQRVSDAIPDTCLLLEHEPVYTAGKRTKPLDRPVGDPGAPVIDVDRGGQITWHGPGQLVGYPIIRLGEPVDVIAYVRAVEEALIRVCADFGVATTRVEGRSGVWVPGDAAGTDGTGQAGGVRPDRKVGAIGLRVSRGVTMHGFALNCDCDLSWFGRIVPCGISDAGVTSLSAETGRQVTVMDTIDAVERRLAEVLGASTWQRMLDTSAPVPAGSVHAIA
ncbi:MAG TPA: lipoyl(octanoyl) transferase LipB [Streptosporangiaceae bacterium]|nr:lipoyl(octanoyl) transferase LipB [Streptosporangiaceae bacterium]